MVERDENNSESKISFNQRNESKNWKAYLKEFLMIFFAVVLGFIADNIREKISDNRKELKLAKNLYAEIYNDSILLQQKITFRLGKEACCNYFIKYVKDSNLTSPSTGG